jgi:hypothetical protein
MQSMPGRLVRLLFLLAVLGLPGMVFGDEPSQAGLVVQFADGRIETRCISFQEAISGADLLLTYSGFDTIVDASSGMGITVCQLEADGCAYPSKPCFCQCMGGGECAYWNYFYREPGSSEWTYSALGAVLRKVQHGSVEAWVWGDGTTPPTFDGTFASICAAPTAAMPTATMEPAVTVEPTASPEPPTALPTTAPTEPSLTQSPEPTGPTATSTITPPASRTAQPASTTVLPAPTQSTEPRGTPSWASYWPFGLMVLGLVAIGLFVRRRGA